MFRNALRSLPSKAVCLGVSTAAAALVVGCTMGWTRPNTTADQTRNDNAECQISAAGRYPPNIIPARSLPTGGPSIDADANQLLRDEEAKYCVRHKGYSFARVR
jgi:hypothetical protein